MIGKYVRYKNSEDTTCYLVVDYAKSGDIKEIAIIQSFPYSPDYLRQLKIWQSLDKFEVENELNP
jgi:hypothetical protein